MWGWESIQRDSGWKNTQIWQKTSIYRFQKLNKLQTGKLGQPTRRHIGIKLLKTKDKEKMSKAAGEATPYPKRKNHSRDGRFLTEATRPEAQGTFQLLVEKAPPSEYDTQWKQPSGQKEKWRLPEEGERRGCAAGRPALQEWLKEILRTERKGWKKESGRIGGKFDR